VLKKDLKAVIESSNLGISDKLVMIAITLNGNEACEEIANYLGMSRVMIYRIMLKLEALGYVSKSQLRRAKQTINLWNITGKIREEADSTLDECRKLIAPIE